MRTVWVEQSGHTIDGLFLDAWVNNQDLFGLPISEEFSTKVSLNEARATDRTVQYFENMALVYVPEDSRGGDWQVQALDLGSVALDADKSQLHAMSAPKSATCGNYTASNCRIFADTGHTLRGPMMAWWDSNDGERLIGSPVSEQFAGPDGATTQYFEKVVLTWKTTSEVAARPIGRQIASLQKVNLTKISQPIDVPTWDEALLYGPLGKGPGPQQGGFKEVVISISMQALWAYEDGKLVLNTLVSTGTAETPEVTTPTGYFQVLTKVGTQTMEGTINGEHYKVKDVPFVMYFDNRGDALHGAYWHNNFGTPMSHGCVNLPMDVAAWLYDWAYVGMGVTVLP